MPGIAQNWRRDNGVDQILQTFPTSPYFKPLMNYWPSTYLGTMSTGYKVFYERLGDVEVKHLLRAIPLDVLISYHIYILESQEREYVYSETPLQGGRGRAVEVEQTESAVPPLPIFSNSAGSGRARFLSSPLFPPPWWVAAPSTLGSLCVCRSVL
jgi:hypothetical protein